MKREPSIHIRKSDLIKIIKSYGEITLENLDEVMREARKHSIDTRSLIIDNKVHLEKITKRTESPTGDANLLSDIIYSVRVKRKHVGVTKIKQGDNQWASVKGLVTIVNDFCNRYEMEKRAGYIEFVETGFDIFESSSKRINYGFIGNALLQKADDIYFISDAKQVIRKDEFPQGTSRLHDYYVERIQSRTGVLNKYTNKPTEYASFVKARLVADDIGISYEDYIDCHFKYLEFCGGIPKITDLFGDNAKKRIIPYIEVDDNRIEKPKVNWESFKN